MALLETVAAPSSVSAAAPGPTQAQRFTFDNTGYLVLENFLSPARVTRLLEATERAVVRRRRALEADPSLSRVTLNNGKKSTRLLYLLDDDPVFQEMIDWAPLMPFVKELLNPKAHHHASDVIVEEGSDLMGRTGGWHIDGNDSGYRRLGYPIPIMQLKVGYYLTDMTRPGNANLTVVPGSHKAQFDPDPEDLKRRDLFPGAIQVCAPAGTAILFHNAIWHTAGAFASPEHRRIMLYHAYEHPWMIGCEENWNYNKDFFNRKLTPAQHKFFPGFFFDPPERRQGWG